MTVLSREAADALRPFAPTAVTDVTGFGLLGHAHEMAERSGVRIELDAASAAALPGRARGCRGRGPHGRRPRGTATSRRRTSRADGVAEELLALAYDPQTSGGLLDRAAGGQGRRCSRRRSRRHGLFLARIGRVVEGAGVGACP